MSLVQIIEVSYAIGDQPILRGASLALEPGERVALIGRNGAGKSTLFKLITGELAPDAGEVRKRRYLRVAQLEQALPLERPVTVFEHVAGGLDHLRGLIAEHQRMSQLPLDAQGLRELTELQHAIEDEGGWDVERRVATVLTEMELPGERRLDELSGGWRRRVGLARALVSNPELLLLDEPTNHLDLATIDWLERRLLGFEGTLLFVTHDRAFLQSLATRVVEIERARLLSFPGDWRNFQVARDAAMEAEARAQALFDKKLAEEEVWVRRGIEARRTRSAGRIRELERMRREYAERIKPAGRARIHVAAAEASGKRVIEMKGVAHRFGPPSDEPPLIDDLSLTVMRGDRIGLIGNNGVGKSTLLKIMLGELAPQRGTVKLGTGIEVGYFDQLRRALDPERTVAETVGDGRDHVFFGGRSIHVVGYLKGFLFSAKRALTKVGALSGGEQNRLILARLFTRPTNLLVLDEPTNDLDVETLEVLEEQLTEYAGTLLIVSHDREFLDNVVTSTLVFEKGGRLRAYPGGYSDWARQGGALDEREGMLKDAPARKDAARAAAAASAELALREAERTRNRGRGKLSYHLQRELDALPGRIEALETEVAALEAVSAAPEFYSKPFAEVQPTLDRLAAARAELDAAVERWAELESLAG